MSAPAPKGTRGETKTSPGAARGRPAGLAAGAVLAMAAAVYFFMQGGRSADDMPRSDGQLYEAVGAAMAEETARVLGSQGKVVVLTPRSGPQPSPVHASFLRGFERALNAGRGVRLAATEPVVPGEAGCPATAFLEVLKKHPGVDAVVSFLGPPVFQRNDLKLLPARRPKLLVLGGDREITQALMGQKVLDVSFVPRPGARNAGAERPKSPQEEIERLYQIVTPATVAAWAAGGKP